MVSQFFCVICGNHSDYTQRGREWPRDFLHCSSCGSNVRERGLFLSLISDFDYKNLRIHESSPEPSRSYHQKLVKECPNYEFSHYFPAIPNGERNEEGILSANIEDFPLEAGSVDIFLSLDVFEHIWNPIKAVQELERILSDRGAAVLTFPIDAGWHRSEKPVDQESPEKVIPTNVGKFKGFTEKLEFHGNPIDESGSLVTHYYGYDVIDLIETNTALKVEIRYLHDVEYFGVTGVMNECIILRKNGPITPINLSRQKNNYYNQIKPS